MEITFFKFQFDSEKTAFEAIENQNKVVGEKYKYLAKYYLDTDKFNYFFQP